MIYIEMFHTYSQLISSFQIVQGLSVVNDVAERGVALVKRYNQCITKDEDQFQYLLLVMNEHQKLYPDSANKSDLKI